MWLAHLKTVITTLLVFTNILSSVYGKATEDLGQDLHQLSLEELDQQERELNQIELSDDSSPFAGAVDNVILKMLHILGSVDGFNGRVGWNQYGRSGVNYVRWGRTVCGGTAVRVYEGRIGGESYNHHGGGAQYLCMPISPEMVKYDQPTNGAAGGRGRVYGAEYQFDTTNIGELRALNEHDAVCAVCSTSKRGQQLMIPAAMECPQGWTEEYHGYLMSSAYGHQHSTGYICVDRNPEAVRGSGANRNGALLYLVDSKCDGASLPCRPYVDGHELTCVVCTK